MDSELIIKPVATRRDKKQFLNLPWAIFKDDPCWIPPLRSNQKELVGFKPHPFYDDAEAQTFLALRGGQPVGRISAIVNHAHNRRHKEQRGFFGFFDSIDDPRVAHGLFDAAREWLSDREMTAIRGPANPSMNNECGLLIEGFDDPPMFMMTYNRPYYQNLVESYGFKKTQDMYAYWGHVEMLDTVDEKLLFVVKEATRRFNVNVRPMNPKKLHEEIELFLKIYNDSTTSMWGFVPLSPSEVVHTGKGMKHMLVPELLLFGEVEGRPIGCVLALLDYNPRIRQIDGKLFPFGFLKLLRKKHEISRIRLISTTVIPEYQRWGIGLVLTDALVPKIREWGIKEVEFSWVLESNDLSRKTLERGGAKRTKTYRMYDLDID